jgi:hypothetical protein
MAALTPGNERTITILPGLRTLLADLKPLHVGPGDDTFTNNRHGGPIHQRELPLRSLARRPSRHRYPATEVLRDAAHLH